MPIDTSNVPADHILYAQVVIAEGHTLQEGKKIIEQQTDLTGHEALVALGAAKKLERGS